MLYTAYSSWNIMNVSGKYGSSAWVVRNLRLWQSLINDSRLYILEEDLHYCFYGYLKSVFFFFTFGLSFQTLLCIRQSFCKPTWSSFWWTTVFSSLVYSSIPICVSHQYCCLNQQWKCHRKPGVSWVHGKIPSSINDLQSQGTSSSMWFSWLLNTFFCSRK